MSVCMFILHTACKNLIILGTDSKENRNACKTLVFMSILGVCDSGNVLSQCLPSGNYL